MYYVIEKEDELSHSGTIGMHWGERRYQYPDGSLTPAGRAHYGVGPPRGSKAGSTNKATRKRVTDAGGGSSGGSGHSSGGSSGGSSNGSRTTPSGRVLSDEDSRRLADMRKSDPEFKRLGEEMDKAEREYQSLVESDNAPRKKLEESEAKYKKAKEALIAYRDKKLDEPANKATDDKKAGSIFSKRQKETTGKSQEEIIQDIVDHGGVRDIANNMGKMSTDQLRAAKSRLEATQALRKQIQSENYEKVDNFIEKYNRVGKVVQTTGNMADSASKVTNFISNVSKLFGKESPEVEAANKAANAAKAAAKVTETIINRADPKEIYSIREKLTNSQRKQAKENIEMDRAIKRLAEEADNRDKSGGNQEPSQKSNKNQGNQPQNNSGQKNDDRPSNITSTGFKTKDNPDDAARYRIDDNTVTRDQLKDRQVEDYRIPDNTVDRDEMLKRLIKKANKK